MPEICYGISKIGMKSKKTNIRIVASRVTGPYHSAKKMACQDFFSYGRKGKKVIAVVADGAGSAKYGQIGAKTVCETMCDILVNASFSDIRQKIIDSLDVARQKLMRHRFNKTKDENGLVDFAATVVGVVYFQNKGLFFHIGDGAGIAFLSDENYIVSQPENGIFSCETYFYTMDDWKDSLRFTPFEKAENLMLMTDGITGFALKNGSFEIESGFVEPINHYLNAEKNKAKALRALNNTLRNPSANRLNSDDKTFLWVGLK